MPEFTDIAWLDRPDAPVAIDRRLSGGEITAEQADVLRRFCADGFVDLGTVLDGDLCDQVAAEIQGFMAANRGRSHDEYLELLQNMYREYPATKRATVDSGILEWCDLVLGTRALPFQTLSLPQGTQIKAHADGILMTTRPHGYMAAAWCALEDIQPDSGPVLLYGGSHRLPYLSPEDLGATAGMSRQERWHVHNDNYYPRIAERVAGREPFRYLPKKGQVLLWHWNVIHGGEAITRPDSSRMSLVVHYFGEGADHFSDMFQEKCVLPGLR